MWVAAGSTVNFCFHGTGSDQPRSSDIFLTSYDEVEGYFVLFVTFKVELLENQIGLLIRFRRN